MSKNAKVLNGPLIYIEQPTFKASVQNQQIAFVRALPKRKDIHQQKELKTEVQNNNEDETENAIENGMHKKGFINKSIDEKLKILTKLPSSIPNLLCEVTTKDQTYTCTIVSYTDDKVYIELLENQEQIELNKNDILSIIIINL